MLTAKQKTAYIKSPLHCPYCNSQDITSGEVDWDEPVGITVTCEHCGKRWLELREVTGIEEIEE
jgi:transcription elongation factor Elf1